MWKIKNVALNMLFLDASNWNEFNRSRALGKRRLFQYELLNYWWLWIIQAEREVETDKSIKRKVSQ